MHATLTPQTNAKLSVLWALMLTACLFISTQPALLPLGGFAIAGLCAGLLQARAIRHDPSKFLAAETALAVRAALASSLGGKVSIALLWLAGAAMLWVVFTSDGRAVPQTVVGSYAAFALTRELSSFHAVAALVRLKAA
jgi:hypothetical protein